MAEYIMTAAEIADMHNDYADNEGMNWRVQSMVDADRDYLADRIEVAENHFYEDSSYDGPDMCIFCDAIVFEDSCSICQEYKGVVSWSDYEKRV